MNNEQREQQMMDASEAYAEEVGYKDEHDLCAMLNVFCAGWRAADNSRWIPVEERLPKENERIIAYNGVFNEIHLCDFHDGIFEDFYGPFDGTITHWMPMPTPPQRKEAKNE